MVQVSNPLVNVQTQQLTHQGRICNFFGGLFDGVINHKQGIKKGLYVLVDLHAVHAFGSKKHRTNKVIFSAIERLAEPLFGCNTMNQIVGHGLRKTLVRLFRDRPLFVKIEGRSQVRKLILDSLGGVFLARNMGKLLQKQVRDLVNEGRFVRLRIQRDFVEPLLAFFFRVFKANGALGALPQDALFTFGGIFGRGRGVYSSGSAII